MQVVTKVRNGEEFLNSDFTGVKIFGTKKDFIFVEMQQQQIVNQLLKIYTKLMNDGFTINDIMVLSCQNKGDYGTKVINKSVQYMLQNNQKNRFVIVGENKFFKNDKVIQIINNYKATTPLGEETEIFNGNTGVIIDVSWDTITVDFGKGKYIVYTKSELNQLELGYCISIHRSQGDASKQIICVAPKSHNFMLNSNLLYVAGTRARERVYMLGNIITVNRAIKKKENLERNTWLKDLLLQSAS
jgi:exodeoxyribonuclease V alpha subunit